MEAFGLRYVEAIDEGALPIRLGDVAEKAGVDRATVSAWRHHTPGFNEWLSLRLANYVAQQWPAVKAVAVKLALRGSIDHMKFVRELVEPQLPRGGGPVPTAPGANIFAGAIIVNVPQPPHELEGHPFVRGLLEQAQTFDASPVTSS